MIAKAKKGATPRSITRWFQPDVKPVRVGMYECKRCVEMGRPETLHYWSGRRWYMARNDLIGDLVPFKWRGLAFPPLPQRRGNP